MAKIINLPTLRKLTEHEQKKSATVALFGTTQVTGSAYHRP
jgi:hypothetical protein